MINDFVSIFLQYTAPLIKKGSEKYYKWAAVAVVSAMLERRCWAMHGGAGRLHPNMYIVLNGHAGSGKSLAIRFGKRLLDDINKTLEPSYQIHLAPDISSPSALFKAYLEGKAPGGLKFDPQKNIRMDNELLRYTALFGFYNEIKNLLRDIGGGSVATTLLDLYDCTNGTRMDTIARGIEFIENPSLGFVGAITPANMGNYLQQESSGAGLISRIIFVNEPRNFEHDFMPPKLNGGLKPQLLQELNRIYKLKGEYSISDEAVALARINIKETQALRKFSAMMGEYVARKAPHLIKLSLCMAAAESDIRTIEIHHMQRAIDWLKEVEENMRHMFGVVDMGKDRRNISMYTVFEMVPLYPARMTFAELHEALWDSGCGYADDALKVAIRSLISSNQIEKLDDGQDGNGIFSRRVK